MYNAAMLNPDLAIGFIGAGNMASAMIEGLLRTGVAPMRLHASAPHPAHLEALAAKGLCTTTDNTALVAACDIVVLAVKPQILRDVLRDLQPILQTRAVLLISVAAGVRCASLESWTHPAQAIVRCMPNTPALVQAGASGLFANARVSAEQRQQAEAIMAAVGLCCWLDDETQLDAVTALSGSGPAYFFLMMEAMEAAGVALGLSVDVARRLCLQTAFGAARLALEGDADPAELRRRVTSPGGTTAAALRCFEHEDYRGLVARALQAAAARAAELAAETGK